MAYRGVASTKKLVSSSDETALRKKLLELHDDNASVFVDNESLLASIEGIINHVMPVVDATRDGREQEQTDEASNLRRIMPAPDSLPDTLPSLLHQITCVLNCKCLGGDGSATALEILQLLENYTWEAKILIILASLVVEYGQYCLVAKLNKSDQLTKLVAMLKRIPDHSDENCDEMINSKFEEIIKLVRLSIELTRFIANFRFFQSKYITNEAQPMIDAINQIPIAVYWMTRVVIACASEYSVIVGKSAEITSSYTETGSLTNLGQMITTIHTSFQTHLNDCNIHISEKKQTKYVEKLKVMLRQTTVQMSNQNVLQSILKRRKDGSRLVLCGLGVENKIEVEALKDKTVLLLISDLEISGEEITKIRNFYEESRTETKYQYEIVWIPIVEKNLKADVIDSKVTELKCKMPWHAIEHPRYVKPGFVKYVREEWRYSKKSMMVSIDQRGRVVHENAFNMIWTWGNAVYPFTQKREQDIWNSRKEWSLKLLVEETTREMSTWIKQDKHICLFGGDNYEWIEKFVKEASSVASAAGVELQMVYIYKKNMREEHVTQITKILSKHNIVTVWDKNISTYFWKRIDCMLRSKVQFGAKITKANETGGDPILPEVINMLTLGDHENGWGLIGQGEGAGPKMIVKAGDVILKAFTAFDSWSSTVQKLGFATALRKYILDQPVGPHHCNRLTLPGIEDILEMMICGECQKPMEKFIMYRCCV